MRYEARSGPCEIYSDNSTRPGTKATTPIHTSMRTHCSTSSASEEIVIIASKSPTYSYPPLPQFGVPRACKQRRPPIQNLLCIKQWSLPRVSQRLFCVSISYMPNHWLSRYKSCMRMKEKLEHTCQYVGKLRHWMVPSMCRA